MRHIREVYYIHYEDEIDVQYNILGSTLSLSIRESGAKKVTMDYAIYERVTTPDDFKDCFTGWQFPTLEEAVAQLHKLQGLI